MSDPADPTIAYIFGKLPKAKGPRPLSLKVKSKLEQGHYALPRRGPIPEGHAYIEEGTKVPILMRLQSPAPYNVYLTIPSKFRKLLKLDKGTLVSVEQQGNALVIRKVEE